MPQIIPFSAGDEVTNAGEVVSFQCTILKGNSPISIYWLFNASVIESSEEVTISKIGKKISTLSIESARADHVGEYTCVAKNAAGATNFTTQLLINGSPIHQSFPYVWFFSYCYTLEYPFFAFIIPPSLHSFRQAKTKKRAKVSSNLYHQIGQKIIQTSKLKIFGLQFYLRSCHSHSERKP